MITKRALLKFHEQKSEGLSISEIARRYEFTRKMVRRYPQCNRLERVALPNEVFCRAATYAAFTTDDAAFADGYADISYPFLTITGDLDLNSTLAMSQKMADLVQNGHAVILQGRGHMMNLTARDEVSATLLDWLNTGEGDRP